MNEIEKCKQCDRHFFPAQVKREILSQQVQNSSATTIPSKKPLHFQFLVRKIIFYEYLQMQQHASSRRLSSGGLQSGKNGFKTYVLNVKATIACEQGLTIIHSIHKRINAKNGPKVVMI